VHPDGGREQRGGDPLPLAAAFALVQRGGDAVGAEHAGQDVGDRDADLGGRTTDRTGDAHQAGLALDDLVEARPVPVGTALAEAGDGQHHQPVVEGLERVGAEPEPVHHPGTEVLDQHVGVADQPAQPVEVVRVLEVEHHRPLRAVHRQEVRRLRPDVLTVLALAARRRAVPTRGCRPPRRAVRP
jgi:hypothetical protein